MEPQPLPPLIDTFAGIMERLRRSLGDRHVHAPPAVAALILLLVRRVWRLNGRVAVLLARFRAGTLRPLSSRPGRRRPAAPAAREAMETETGAGTTGAGCIEPARPAKPKVPGGYAWMVRLSQGTASSGHLLHHMLLHDPEMAALVAASPGLKRTLRALMWALGWHPQGIPVLARADRPPPKPPRPALQPKAAPPARPPVPQPGPALPPIGLPSFGLVPSHSLFRNPAYFIRAR